MNYLMKTISTPISVVSLIRHCSSVSSEFINRNPRNLEKMRLARKPTGYHLDKPGRCFWHKLILTKSNRAVRAELVHFQNGPVVVATTSEWALRKQLFSIIDTNAFVNLGRVFSQRCLESGITEMFCNIKPIKGGKVERFLEEVTKSGIVLSEPERYTKPNPWDLDRPVKPWTVTED